MKINFQFVAVTIPFSLILFVSSFGNSMTNYPPSQAQQCSLSHQSLRLCIGRHWSNNPEISVTLSLCQNKSNPDIGYIILFSSSAEGKLLNQNTTSGSVTIDKRNNIMFLSKAQSTRYSILFTNDGDEAYVTLSKDHNGDIADSHTLYCQ